jgi:hypothetical protein
VRLTKWIDELTLHMAVSAKRTLSQRLQLRKRVTSSLPQFPVVSLCAPETQSSAAPQSLERQRTRNAYHAGNLTGADEICPAVTALRRRQ